MQTGSLAGQGSPFQSGIIRTKLVILCITENNQRKRSGKRKDNRKSFPWLLKLSHFGWMSATDLVASGIRLTSAYRKI